MRQINIEDMVQLYETNKAQGNPDSEELRRKYGVSIDENKDVIAAKDFSQGETIKKVNPYGVTDLETVMQFEKRYQDKKEDMDPDAQRLLQELIQIERGEYLVPKEFEFSIKHSCNPNAAFVPYKDKGKTKFAFKVLKPIKKGDKIRFDYSTVTGDEYVLECSCDDKECRGFAARPAVHSNEEKKKILARYPEGWLLPYIEKELKAPFPGKKLQYLDKEPYPETVIYSFDGLKQRKTWDAKVRNMKELLEGCSKFHPKFKDMMMEYIEEE